MLYNLKKIFILATFSIALIAFFGFSNIASSSVFDNIKGFAWNGTSDGGTPPNPGGWISFNCINTGSDCTLSNYGLNKNADGTLTGHVWHQSLGWIKFGGLNASDMPNDPDNPKINAKVFPDGHAEGWARACVVAQNPSTCNGWVDTYYTGGWDGWISLYGQTPNYGLTFDAGTREYEGYAWGGPIVMGWISFNCNNPGSDCTYPYKVEENDVAGPTVFIDASPNPVDEGEYTVLTWTGTNLDQTIPCVSTDGYVGDTNWAGSRPYSPSTYTTVTLPKGTHTYSIQCFGPGNVPSNISSVEIISGIDINFYAEPSAGYPQDYITMLHWKAVPANTTFTSCNASTSSSGTNWTDPISLPPGSRAVVVPDNPTVYNIVCYHNGNPVEASVSVPRVSPPETIVFSNTAVVNNKTDLTWITKNMQNGSCVASNNHVPPVTQWDGGKANSGTTVDVDVPSGGNTTYVITCTGLSGNQRSAQLILNENSGASIKSPIFREG